MGRSSSAPMTARLSLSPRGVSCLCAAPSMLRIDASSDTNTLGSPLSSLPRLTPTPRMWSGRCRRPTPSGSARNAWTRLSGCGARRKRPAKQKTTTVRSSSRAVRPSWRSGWPRTRGRDEGCGRPPPRRRRPLAKRWTISCATRPTSPMWTTPTLVSEQEEVVFTAPPPAVPRSPAPPAPGPAVPRSPAPPAPAVHVPTAAEAHAGMLDPWSDPESPTRNRPVVPPPEPVAPIAGAAPTFESDESSRAPRPGRRPTSVSRLRPLHSLPLRAHRRGLNHPRRPATSRHHGASRDRSRGIRAASPRCGATCLLVDTACPHACAAGPHHVRPAGARARATSAGARAANLHALAAQNGQRGRPFGSRSTERFA